MANQRDGDISGSSPSDSEAWPHRMRRSAMALEAQRQRFDDERDLRDGLVLEGVDAGVAVSEVARQALISPARVHQVIARIG